jgi:hypothetical protein
MPRVGLKPTIPVLEQAKTFHALDRVATVIVTIPLVQFFFLVSWDVLRLSSLGTLATIWPIVLAPDDR